MVIKSETGRLEIYPGSYLYSINTTNGQKVYREWDEMVPTMMDQFEEMVSTADELMDSFGSVVDRARREGMN